MAHTPYTIAPFNIFPSLVASAELTILRLKWKYQMLTLRILMHVAIEKDLHVNHFIITTWCVILRW
jgi:hypothetical protein